MSIHGFSEDKSKVEISINNWTLLKSLKNNSLSAYTETQESLSITLAELQENYKEVAVCISKDFTINAVTIYPTALLKYDDLQAGQRNKIRACYDACVAQDEFLTNYGSLDVLSDGTLRVACLGARHVWVNQYHAVDYNLTVLVFGIN